jgi:biopolymer transport protein ExbD
LATGARTVTGVDVSADALTYARENYRPGNVNYVQSSAAALPFSAHSFDMIAAFEVIEHLSYWRDLLAESRRVLCPGGLLLVSTPNKSYYAESRIKDGPNPFHVHEFECEEFREALAEFFPRVTILLQNRLESFAFYPQALTFRPVEARIDGARGATEHAHFFLGICSTQPIADVSAFVYVPRAANMLREREQHIQLLETELDQTKQWLAQAVADRQQLLEAHEKLHAHLEEKNQWALTLDADWKAALERVATVQDELHTAQLRAEEVAASYARKVSELEQESRQTAAWATESEQQLKAKGTELAETVRLLDRAEATVVERTEWAQQLQTQLEQVETVVAMVRKSRWVKLGRAAGLGPKLDINQVDE